MKDKIYDKFIKCNKECSKCRFEDICEILINQDSTDILEVLDNE